MCKELESALTQLGIEYTGVHYTAIENADKVYFPEIAELQYKYFKKIMSNTLRACSFNRV